MEGAVIGDDEISQRGTRSDIRADTPADEQDLPSSSSSSTAAEPRHEPSAHDVDSIERFGSRDSSGEPVEVEDRDFNYLRFLGFNPNMVKNALMTRTKEQAFEYLRSTLPKTNIKIWDPPVRVHVGELIINFCRMEHCIFNVFPCLC